MICTATPQDPFNVHNNHSCVCLLFTGNYQYYLVVSLQMSISAIDFREYKSAKDLEDDENRDFYPPRFITALNCHQQSALHVEYMLHVMKDDKSIGDYKFIISRSVSKACHEGNKVYYCELT